MRKIVLLLSVLAVATAYAQQKPEQKPEQPKFETTAEVVLVDVTVSSGDGEPVTGLTASDFKLTVNGQPRPVHTAQFISTRGMKPAAEVPRLAKVSSNDGPTSGRLLLFAVDENHLRLGGARAVLKTAERVMSSLAAGDAVGVARLPTGRGGVEFTTDRERVRRGLQGVMGAEPMRRVEKVRLSEAHAFEIRDENTWQQVIERECGSTSTASVAGGSFEREACIDQIEADARQVLSDAVARARTSIRAFEQLAERLAALKTPVSVILISEGLYVGRDREDLSRLARLAAEARLTFYVVQPDESLFDLDTPRTTAGFAHESVLGEGLEQIAGLTRGAFFKITGGGDGAFNRISRELSGYYLLAFEPTDADRTSRDRRIKVEVDRRGITVKARSTYALGDSTAARDLTSLPPEEQVKSLLASPMPAPGLPMRVATYSVIANEANRVRVVVAAEIGDPATSPAEWPVGVLVFNSQDKVFVDSTRYMTLEPVTNRAASPRMLTMTMVLEPGEYSMRLAAVDHEGKSGSVHHTIDARLHRLAGNAVQTSDFMISSDLADGAVPRPIPTAMQHTEMMYSVLEMTGDAARVGKSRVNVQIADTESSPALVNVEARPLPGGTQTRRTFAAVAKLDVLPPGDYVARAVVKVPGQADAVLSRPFRLEPIAAAVPTAAATAPRSVDDAPAPLPAAKVAAPVARFAMSDVLQPAITRRFIEYLQREHPVAEAHAAIVQQALNGKFEPALESNRPLGDDEVTLAFIRGLAYLQSNQYPQATASFQLALRGASDFLGAGLYIGAVHAAAGRDTDAIGAWQMATIGEHGGAVYPLLVDAMLRIGDAKNALDTIAEMPEAWPDDDSRMKRIATAQAMLGQFEPAMQTLTELLERHADDEELLFLTIQVLYRQHQAKALPPAERARFDQYSKRYVDAKGPESALVQTWRKFVLR
jgi:VWFA-related protein